MPTDSHPIPTADWRRTLVPADGDREAAADLARGLATLLDSVVTVPGTRFRVGLDAMLGVVPVVGDLAGAAVSGYILLLAVRAGVPRPVLARMLMNLGTDAVVGAVPVVGDVFDAAYRSNLKNARLLEHAVTDPQRAGRASWWAVAGVLLAVFGIAVAGIALAVWLASLLIRHVA